MTDWLFEHPARGGYFVIAKPAGFAWGPGERDAALFAVVRAAEPPADEQQLRERRLALAAALAPLEGNVFAGAQFRPCAESEWLPAPDEEG